MVPAFSYLAMEAPHTNMGGIFCACYEQRHRYALMLGSRFSRVFVDNFGFASLAWT